MTCRRSSAVTSSAFISLALLSLTGAAHGQTLRPPSVAKAALAIVSGISGLYMSSPGPTSGWGMPSGPVMGNGDVGVVLEGPPDSLRFCFGKSDFFGVLRGGAMPVGSLSLHIPGLKGATYKVRENIGTATLTGVFTATTGAACEMTSWVNASNNTTVIRLHNTGNSPFTVSDQLFDNYGTGGNPATFGEQSLEGGGENVTWLRVSPDTEFVDLGNRLHGGPPDPLNGQVASVQVYGVALSPAALADRAAPRDVSAEPFAVWSGQPYAKVMGSASIGSSPDHGATANIDGKAGSAVELGAMRLPQSRLTVTAWVKIASATAEQGIFTALGDPLSPRGYPFERGVELELVNGCLSGKLNTTAATASSSLPLNQWVKVALVYDGARMSLYSDGVEVASTSAFPTTGDVNGYDQKSLHFGDRDLPYNGDGPTGIMLQRIVGSDAASSGPQLSFNVLPYHTATILVTIETDRNSKNYWNDTFAQVAQPNFTLMQQQHQAWWRDFWSKSFIQISDTAVQNYWYGSLYVYACCSRPGCPPPGLWGNFIDSPYAVGWQGDYTLDYNAEAPPWAAYESNHWALADNYEDPLLAYMSRGTAIAKHNGYTGLYFYTHLTPGPGWDDDPSQFMSQQSGTIFGCVDCAMRWKLTDDIAYARKVYPLLRGTSEFWDHYLKLENGQFVDTNDATDEGAVLATNPATTVAFLHMLYPALIQMSVALGRDKTMRPIWQNIYAHLSPLPIVKAATINQVGGYSDDQTLEQILGPGLVDDKFAIRDSQAGTGFPNPRALQTDDSEHGTSAGMNSTQAIYPGWQIGLRSSVDDQQAALETVTLAAEWFDSNDDCTFYPAAAVAGYGPDQILGHLDRLIKDHSSPSFIFHTGGGGIEDVSIIPASLSEMFQQSFQGVIHIFPNWPKADDASFGNIPACGGFLLASAQKNGKIQYVQITSKAGKKCVLANPWPGKKVELVAPGKSTELFSGQSLSFLISHEETVFVVPQ